MLNKLLVIRNQSIVLKDSIYIVTEKNVYCNKLSSKLIHGHIHIIYQHIPSKLVYIMSF